MMDEDGQLSEFARQLLGRPSRPSTSGGWYADWLSGYSTAASAGGQAHVLFLGDSVTQGFYGGTPYYSESFAGKVASALATRTGESVGTGWVPVHDEFDLTDARLAHTGTWPTYGAAAGFYGSGLRYGAAADVLTFTATCSAFRIMYLTLAAGGAWTATVDAGTPANYTSNGADGVVVADIDAGGSGSHTLTLTATGLMFIVAVEAVANPTTGVKVSRVAKTSTEASDLLSDSSGIDSRSCLAAIGSADLAVISFGLNEANNGTSTSTFDTNLRAAVADCQALGASVVLLVPPPPNPTFIANWTDYRTVILDVVAALGCGVVDLTDAWGSYSVAADAYYHDDVHPNSAGHADIARLLAYYIGEAVDPTTPSTWVPSDVSNLALWLDASDDSSFTYSSGTLVSQWNDLSGNARHFTQATVASQPSRSGAVSALAAVDFDGVDDTMSAGDTLDLGTSSLTIFAVVKQHLAATRAIIGKYKVTPPDGAYLMYIDAGNFKSIYDAGTIASATTTSFTSIDASRLGIIVDRAAGSITQRVNAATDGTASFTPDSGSSRNISPGLYIGALRNSSDSGFQANYWLNGFLCEVLVYTQAVGSTDRDAIEAYLKAKWKLLT